MLPGDIVKMHDNYWANREKSKSNDGNKWPYFPLKNAIVDMFVLDKFHHVVSKAKKIHSSIIPLTKLHSSIKYRVYYTISNKAPHFNFWRKKTFFDILLWELYDSINYFIIVYYSLFDTA